MEKNAQPSLEITGCHLKTTSQKSRDNDNDDNVYGLDLKCLPKACVLKAWSPANGTIWR